MSRRLLSGAGALVDARLVDRCQGTSAGLQAVSWLDGLSQADARPASPYAARGGPAHGAVGGRSAGGIGGTDLTEWSRGIDGARDGHGLARGSGVLEWCGELGGACGPVGARWPVRTEVVVVTVGESARGRRLGA